MSNPTIQEKVRHRPRNNTSRVGATLDRAPALEIVYRDPKSLRPNARNARKHPESQIHKLAAAITQFGFLAPVAISADGTLLAGHGRVEAAVLAGLTQVPTITINHLSEAEVKAHAIADNRLSEVSEWDFAILREELKELSAMDLDFELDLTGFSSEELDDIIYGEVEDKENDPADHLPEVQEQTVSQLGDIWQLGDHRLLVGSSVFATSFTELLGAERAQMVISDAPYGVHTNAIGNSGRTKHPDFVQGGGEQTREEFIEFLGTAFRNMADFSIPGSAHFLFMDHGHTAEMLSACTPIFGKHKNLILWVKPNAGLGSCYRSQHELVWLFKTGSAKDKMINNFGLGATGRYRTNVWMYRGMAGFSRERDALLKSHPTVKPHSLVADAMRDCSKRGGIVLDGFAGSGTIFIAAEKTGRRGYGIELDPRYADVCVKRWQKFTAKEALLLNSGQTFNEVAVVRSTSQRHPE